MLNSRRRDPSGLAWAAAVLWAALPLLTCGMLTPFTIAFAAFWLRSVWQVIAAAFYTVCVGSFLIVIFAYDTFEDIPEPMSSLVSLALVVTWLGGVIHSAILVPRLVRARHLSQPASMGEASRQSPPPYIPPPDLRRSPDPRFSRPDVDPRFSRPDVRRDSAPHTPAPDIRQRPARHTPAPNPAAHHTPTPDIHRSPSSHQIPGPGVHQGPGRHAPAPDIHQRTTSPTYDQRSPGEPEWIGPYRVLRSLGRGGQGAVYLAQAPSGARVAVKVLHDLVDETARARFAREVEAAQRVATFSTARVLDVNISGQHAYIVSEYVEGPSLEQLVRNHGPRDEDGLTRLALSTAGALAAIHKAGVVHRDFKPSNVLIGNDGPRVIDFGIARALDQVTVTSGKMVGTPPYMSPEQLTGAAVGPSSDVFSWGVTMMFAATGRPAFGEDTVPAVFHRVLTFHPDLSPLPPGLRKIVGSCLQKAPEDRPAAADVMLAIIH
ncbi:serine/threonine-protein kinase [Nonomuraea rhodomycinica]|uniref:Protein kinase n=1 Tax=Nonomuraea rhodomycinica TaxID=1712872 RepID=A0A7Y6IXM6_9ACTN|nr:serine/threonine-protein kinase [Nonomuraea rhodomycinica]NUW44949.1 protein kinase [Nonomuraea rhodomycinica]